MSYYGKPVPEGCENMGKPWKSEEQQQLLKGIQDKIQMEDIAKAHKRTIGGIRSRLREIAVTYYLKESKPINEICVLTGLSKDDVIDGIIRREYTDELKANKKPKAQATKSKSESSELQEILVLLNTIEKRVSDYIKEKSLFDE